MNNPTLIATPFAENGDKNTIPESVPLEPQNATLEKGFPLITQQKISEGGIPPERQDFNGALNLITQHTVFLNKGGRYGFNAEFANKIGGYEKGACLTLNNGTQVVSDIDANTNDPNVNMTGWAFPPIKVNASSVLDESGKTQQEINNALLKNSTNPLLHGAVGDGVADDTTALRDCFAEIILTGKSLIDYSSSTYRFTSDITVNAPNKKLRLVGNSVFKSGANYITFSGNIENVGSLTQSATANANTIDATLTSPLAANDVLIIHNSNSYSFSPHRTYYQDGEFNKVSSILDSTITLSTPLATSYPLGGVNLFKLSPISLDIDGLTFECNGLSALRLIFANNSEINTKCLNSLNIRNASYALIFDRCLDCIVTGGQYIKLGLGNSGTDYGIISSNSQNIKIKNSYLYGHRHGGAMGGGGVDGGVPNRNVIFEGCVIDSARLVGTHTADIHGNSIDCQYVNCDIYGMVGMGGIRCYSKGNRISIVDAETRSPILLVEPNGEIGSIGDTIVNSGAAINIMAWSSLATGRAMNKPYSFIVKDVNILTSKITAIMNAVSVNTMQCKFIVDGFNFVDGVPATFTRIITYAEGGATGVTVAQPTLIQASGAKNAISEDVLPIANHTLAPLSTKRVDSSSGSNANGRWIRYSDGTQVCTFRVARQVAFNTAYQSIFKSDNTTWTFPKAFISTNPVVVGTAADNASQSVKTTAMTLSSVSVFGISTVSYTEAGVTFDLVATGRFLS